MAKKKGEETSDQPTANALPNGQVRVRISKKGAGRIAFEHDGRDLPRFAEKGDVLVVDQPTANAIENAGDGEILEDGAPAAVAENQGAP